MIKANSLSYIADEGRILENAVFIHLRNFYKNICYYKNGKTECDFLIKEKTEIILAIQVCMHINTDNIKREIQGLKDALNETKCANGYIITLNQDDTIDGINLISAWQWMSETQKYL